MRLPPESRIAVRLALIATLVIGAVATTIAIQKLDASRRPSPAPVASGAAATDAELLRCRDLGMAAAEDEGCLAAWSDEQRRFFGTSENQITEPAPSGPPPTDGAAGEAVDEQAGGMEAP